MGSSPTVSTILGDNISKKNYAVVIAHELGYVVDEYGNVISPYSNKQLKLVNSYNNTRKVYLKFSINHNKKHYNVMVHKLVAFQKFGKDCFGTDIVVRHLNDDSTDNSYNNIDIGTQSDNQNDRSKDDLVKCAINASTNIRKFSDIVVSQIKSDRLKGMTYTQLMDKYNISSKGSVNNILNRKYVTKKE